MKLENSTDFPNYFLRRMISFCCRELDLPVKSVRRATIRNRKDGGTSGHAVPYRMEFIVSNGYASVAEECSADSPGAYLVLNRDQTTGRELSRSYKRRRVIPYPARLDHTRNFDYFLHVVAHELAHLEQSRRGFALKSTSTAGSGRRLLRNGGSEKNTEALTRLVTAAFAARRAELLAAWSAEPARVCASPAVCDSSGSSRLMVKRAAKAAADLKRWERKAKLAKTKVAAYRRRVAYYARKLGELPAEQGR